MISSLLFVAGFALTAIVQSQSSTTSYIQAGVPTGTPIAGNYTGALRPQIHYSPPKDFMASGFYIISYLPSFPLHLFIMSACKLKH